MITFWIQNECSGHTFVNIKKTLRCPPRNTCTVDPEILSHWDLATSWAHHVGYMAITMKFCCNKPLLKKKKHQNTNKMQSSTLFEPLYFPNTIESPYNSWRLAAFLSQFPVLSFLCSNLSSTSTPLLPSKILTIFLMLGRAAGLDRVHPMPSLIILEAPNVREGQHLSVHLYRPTNEKNLRQPQVHCHRTCPPPLGSSLRPGDHEQWMR